MTRIRQRDAAAFETLCDRYRNTVQRYLYNTVRDADAADDLVQEVWLRVWNAAAQWSGRGTVKSWIFRIATNQALNHIRSQRRHPQRPLVLPPDAYAEGEEPPVPYWMIDTTTPGPEEQAEEDEERADMQRLVGALPASKRDVVRLVYGDELELREVAKTLGVPVGTVKSRLHYATRQLARAWREHHEGEE